MPSEQAMKAAEKIIELAKYNATMPSGVSQLNPINIATIIDSEFVAEREAVRELCDAVNQTLAVLNAWGTAIHSNKTPTAAEWSAYQGMVRSNYIALAARLRAALDKVKGGGSE